MTPSLQPTVEPVGPSERCSELTAHIREGRYRVSAYEVADRILNNFTAPQTRTLPPDRGTRWSDPDRQTDTGLDGGYNRHDTPSSSWETTAALPSPTEVRNYLDWVRHHRHLQDAELAEVAVGALTPEETVRYHEWVQHHRRIEDTEIEALFDIPGGLGPRQDT